MTEQWPAYTPAGFEPAFNLADYYPLFIFALIVMGLGLSILLASHLFLLKPGKRTAVKSLPYESGVDPIGSGPIQFDVKFHLIAIAFLIFDIELLFLYPWALTLMGAGFDGWRVENALIYLLPMIVFTILLALGYIYELYEGVFRWR